MSAATSSNLVFLTTSLIVLAAIFLPLFPRGFRAWNTGTVVLVLWIAIGCLNGATNAGLWWAADDRNSRPIFCEISVILSRAAMFGIPLAAFAVTHRFYRILRQIETGHTNTTNRKPRNRRVVSSDLALCLLPLIPYTLLPFAAQIRAPRRFEILATVGCAPAFDDDAAAYVLVFVPPMVISIAALVYCLIALYLAVNSEQKQADIVADLNITTFLRISLLVSGGLLFFLLPSMILQLVALPALATVANNTDGWLGAGDWGTTNLTLVSVEFTRWAMGPAFALAMLLVLGTGSDAMKGYAEIHKRIMEMRTALCCCCSRCKIGTKTTVDEMELPTVAQERGLPAKAADWDAMVDRQTRRFVVPLNLETERSSFQLVIEDFDVTKHDSTVVAEQENRVQPSRDSVDLVELPSLPKLAEWPRGLASRQQPILPIPGRRIA
uniref:Pheromone receptor Rcb2 B44 n=1 Tax=Mycena chlorophos TaxID=658473 RepID=A0ABQ0M7C5_MYCCL|nr:pheromone receptor Rcb2 B44 [Mycena chlorophos]